METCLLLSARRYDFKDDAGKQVEGVTLTYVTSNVEVEGDTRGCQPLSVAGPSSLWPKLEAIPGVYDLDFKQRPGPKGKPTLQLVGMKYRAAIDLGFDDVPES